ncbi:unnamed protein product [Thelazia callipaeda]|uniref:UDP-N-acetylglucosamine transferase subunit ALG14 n=1 Tax=Thelazia callipaeda TaxID=103827 RepID=A0A0N5CVH5_THECL|nr:unnamed protein product [Thelazia callipaeda]
MTVTLTETNSMRTSSQGSASMLPFMKMQSNASGKSQSLFLSATQHLKKLKKRTNGGNGLMMIAILHLLLACGLIDSGMFLSIRFNHYGQIWPDSYQKLLISNYRLFRHQMIAIRILYSPVAICIGLMVFFPKMIYLLIIFFSTASYQRTIIVDIVISLLSAVYASITGTHAYIILHNISLINLGDNSDILCYIIRGPRENASQMLRDRCLLTAYKMFGNHLLLQSTIAIFVITRHFYSVGQLTKHTYSPCIPLRICSVLGSGGHSTELLSLMAAFEKQFHHRIYVVADTDKLSIQKVIEFEKSLDVGHFQIEQINRSREVGQSYVTSAFTTLISCFQSLLLVWNLRPDVVLCNGPGVCIPICFAAALFDFFRLCNIRLFYIESLCRVKKLSLTGQILYKTRILDIFFVHWRDLVERYPRSVLIPCIK